MTAVSGSEPAAASREDNELLASQVQELWNRLPIGSAASLVNSVILVGILRREVDPRLLWGWFAAIGLVTAFRFVQLRSYRAAIAAGELDSAVWDRRFALGIGVSGVSWGSASVFLFPASIPYQTFLAFVVGGMVAGATATFSARMPAFLAFTVPAVVPLSVRFFMEGDELHVAMAAMILLFGVLLTATAYRVHAATSNWIAVRNELGHAHSHLSFESQHAAALSEELKNAKAALTTRDQDLGDRIVRYMVEVTDIVTTLQDRVAGPLASRERATLRRQKLASLSTFARGFAQHAGRPVDTIRDALACVWKRPERYPSLESLTRTLVDIENANDQLDDLLVALRRVTGARADGFEPVDLGELSESVSKKWMNGKAYRFGLSTDFAPDVVISGNRIQLGLALEQLLTNAFEAIDPVEGWIEASVRCLDANEIDFNRAYLHEYPRADRYAAVTVADNGVGIASETVELMFDPFFTTKVADRGFRRGLGLTEVLAILREHRGEVIVGSLSREGTTVQLLFPLD